MSERAPIDTTSKPFPYELRIGVTGHRNLADPDAVEQAVERLLDRIQDTLESANEFPRGPAGPKQSWIARIDRVLVLLARLFWWTIPVTPRRTPEERRTPLGWTAVSALAKGSDRIVARKILDRGGRLEAVSPFRLGEYRQDFTAPEDLKEFDELLARDKNPTILELPPGDPTESGSEAAARKRRNEGYFLAGAWVIDRCEILIAIWDGKEAQGHGGTGDIVASALRRGRTVFHIDSNSPEKPARSIRAADNSTTASVATSGLPKWTATELPKRAHELAPDFHQLSAYNRDPARTAPTRSQTLEDTHHELRADAEQAGLPDGHLDPVFEHVLPLYAQADSLARIYQNLHRRTGNLMYGLAAFAVTVAVVQCLFFAHDLWIIWFEVAAMLGAIVLLRADQSEAWHQKWLNDRELAEQLRGTMFTAVMGPAGAPKPAVDQILPFYPSPAGWMIDAVRRIQRRAAEHYNPPIDVASTREYLRTAWIAEQAGWHAKNAKTKESQFRAWRLAGLSIFLGTLLFAILHAIGVGHESHATGHGHDHTHDHASGPSQLGLIITALTVALPAISAAVYAISSLREYERIAKRSHRMSLVLKSLEQESLEADDEQSLRAIVAKTERIMATENHEWLVSLSFRGLELA